ncbi:MAG: hypothetical protein Q7U92_19505, partial [Bradyrhizobium sp.]|nr:hypothetical protein [Bradyrhizobium sp.]
GTKKKERAVSDVSAAAARKVLFLRRRVKNLPSDGGVTEQLGQTSLIASPPVLSFSIFLAERLSSRNFVRQRVEQRFVFRAVDRIQPKGFVAEFQIYELVARRTFQAEQFVERVQ